MSREWKPRPGDVALIRYVDDDDGDLVVGIATTPLGSWRTQEHGTTYAVEVVRPLVVIDPEDREQVEKFCVAMANQGLTDPLLERRAVRAALHSLVTPPKPDEPRGLGAVVELADGRQAVRVPNASPTGPTWIYGPFGEGTRWEHLDVARVVREGVDA